MSYKIYLAGEIHSDWRKEIISGCDKRQLDVQFSSPVTDHEASDSCGDKIFGEEEAPFWRDHKSASLNAIRTRHAIQIADLVIVKFGIKYKQWNAAFEAGLASAMGKSLITIHPQEFDHALKEIDAAADAVARNHDQIIEVLGYLLTQR